MPVVLTAYAAPETEWVERIEENMSHMLEIATQEQLIEMPKKRVRRAEQSFPAAVWRGVSCGQDAPAQRGVLQRSPVSWFADATMVPAGPPPCSAADVGSPDTSGHVLQMQWLASLLDASPPCGC